MRLTRRKVGFYSLLTTPFIFIVIEYELGIISGQLCSLLSILYFISECIMVVLARKYRFLLLFLLFFMATPSLAIRPKIGLALGGGGAKGAATIGALKIIEDAGIKIDFIAGTSIGAVIGGLYASGFSLDEIEKFLLSINWMNALDINQIKSELRKQLITHDYEYIEDTTIPFRCVAVDIANMKEYVLSNGILWKAVLASMSVPIVYPWVAWKNKALNDGGLLNNLPVDVVKAMGADIVIAIDLQQNEDDGLYIPSVGLGGIFDMVADWSVKRPDKIKYKENVKAADIYIHPSLTGYTAASFGRTNCEIMKIKGEEEAKKHWNELIKLKQNY